MEALLLTSTTALDMRDDDGLKEPQTRYGSDYTNEWEVESRIEKTTHAMSQ